MVIIFQRHKDGMKYEYSPNSNWTTEDDQWLRVWTLSNIDVDAETNIRSGRAVIKEADNLLSAGFNWEIIEDEKF